MHAIAAQRYHGHSSKRRPHKARHEWPTHGRGARVGLARLLRASTDINYKKLKDDALPDAASISSDSDPLSGLLDDAKNNDGWARFHANVENREEIRTDLERLVVDGFPESHFKDPQRQTLMLDVLTVWAAINKLGYRQGMHELLAVFCEALEQEKREGFNNFAQSGVSDGPFNEADAYVLFDALMAHQAPLLPRI